MYSSHCVCVCVCARARVCVCVGVCVCVHVLPKHTRKTNSTRKTGTVLSVLCSVCPRTFRRESNKD